MQTGSGPLGSQKNYSGPLARLPFARISSPTSWEAKFVVFGREPIFSKTHTNEFCGMRFFGQKPAGPCAALHTGRWVYEKEAKQLTAVGLSGSPWAPLRGSLHWLLLVPFHTSPLSRGALRSAGVPTIAASTSPAPRLPGICPGGAASGKTLKAQGKTPCAPRGGQCGCLAVRQTFSKPPGVPTGWGSLRAEPPGRASSWGA